ncbi:hypothetical protein DPMN_112528 [Dreissena polymorpha]|uniref:Uncharacterized protein n=1 Tax=Dreissena polymorpha TaxID=45954 RepID=A0A9D4KFT7_DREPO|nr:hypothetical protein DPMN_112528 [Dreissena polymorpha]
MKNALTKWLTLTFRMLDDQDNCDEITDLRRLTTMKKYVDDLDLHLTTLTAKKD